ncbi:MAG: hypothetical protein EXR70_09990 [Deltaproteobacteria bacterium]|nr:hypothetical protein [Deltaproteobacteria bacterium]
MVVVDSQGLMVAIGIWIGFGAILYILIESEAWLTTFKISWLVTGGSVFIVYALINASGSTYSTFVSSVQPPVAPLQAPKPKAKILASLVPYDGPKIKSSNALEAQFIDDGSGSGKALVNDIATQQLRGTFTTIKPGATDWPKPKILDRATLNKLQILSDRPWIISTVSNADTTLECVYGETRPLGQTKGACGDTRGNLYHVRLLP